MDRILVIQTASIGDVVLATSLLEKLHSRYPAAEISLLVQKGPNGLFEDHPFLHHIYVWNKKSRKYRGMHRIIRQIRHEDFDLVVNVQRFAATGWICLRSGAHKVFGFNKNPFSWSFDRKVTHEISSETYVYEADRNQRLIETVTEGKAAATRIYPSDRDYDSVLFYKDRPYLTLSPSSLWFTKQFPKEQWIRLIHQLDAGYRIFLLGSKKDIPLCEEIRMSCPEHDVVNLSGKLSLLQSAALMQSAARNFTNDSAPLHLAVAVNAPVTAVFCSTVKAFGFAPEGENIRIVETTENLPCRPCGLHGHAQCPEQHFRCAWNISIEELLKTVPLWKKQ